MNFCKGLQYAPFVDILNNLYQGPTGFYEMLQDAAA